MSMSAELDDYDVEGWICQKCQVTLELLPVDITYMGSNFQVKLYRCPKCDFTFIPADLAMGKMLEVEKILEDK